MPLASLGRRAGKLSLINLIFVLATSHISYFADLLWVSLRNYRQIHRSVGWIVAILRDRFISLQDDIRNPQTLSGSTQFPVRTRRASPPQAIAEEAPKIKYHRSYHVDQAGPGVIALKDVEAFLSRLIKERRISGPWEFQSTSHKNVMSLINFYESDDLIYLVYEYEHLPVSLGCVAEIVDFSEADIATVCREVLDGLHYIHMELRISYGAVDCSNIFLTWNGEVKLGTQDFSIFNMR